MPRTIWGHFTIAALVLAGCVEAHASEEKTQSRCAVIVGSNDVHGVIEPYALSAPGGVTVHGGGVIAASAYLKNLRAAYGDRVVLLDGGDLYQGTLPSNLSLGRAMIDAYNVLGYTASAVGNHEFDFGAATGSNDRLGIVKARIAGAKFPFLTLNIFERSTGQRVTWPNTQPSLLRDFGGIKVGIMGVATPETPRVTRPRNVTDLDFRDPAPLVLAEARALRQRGAQLVVLVGHIGGKCRDLQDPNNTSSCERSHQDSELYELLEGLPAGTIDVAVGGHTHSFMAHWINGTATIESGARGQDIGWVEACLAPGGGIDRAHSTIHGAVDLCLEEWAEGGCRKRNAPSAGAREAKFLDKPLVPSAELTAAMRPYIDSVAATADRRVGVTLPRALGVDALASLVAESLRRSTHSDFGMQNRGGVRTELPAGPLTFGQVFQVLPFDNLVVQVRLSGAAVEKAVRTLSARKGDAAPSLAGLTVVRDGDQVRVMTSKGEPLDASRKYTLATNDFLLQGGDGADFAGVAPADVRTTDWDMREILIRLLGEMYPG